MNSRKGWKKGTVITVVGLLLIMAALLLTLYNIWSEQKAGACAEETAAKLEEQIAERAAAEEEPEVPLYQQNPDMEMPTAVIDGQEYMGILEIPSLNRQLPVLCGWSYVKLKQAPCCYQGSAYSDDLIIAAHNYRTHFGGIRNLSIQDEIRFTDMDGNLFRYQVVEIQELAGTAVEDMRGGDWDLTLFTCTYGGKSRVTVRCKRYD